MVYHERKELLDAGYCLPKYIPYEDFIKQCKKHNLIFNHQAIAREFFDDYLTTSCKNVEDYVNKINED